MNRIDKIELLKKISKGQVTKDEVTADFVICTFLDLMKCASLSDEQLAGKKILFKDPMRTFFEELEAKNQ